jgi:leader peptidase (prepilin peptidase)/N-methyltransferase
MLPLVLVVCFLIGCAVGGVLNVCASRLPWEKSLLWPGPRCFSCYQPIRWYDQIPILGYLLVGGRCRTCRQPFGIRFLLVELFTGLAFAGLFYLEIVRNVLDLPSLAPLPVQEAIARGEIPWVGWGVFAAHAVLLSFLILVTITDLEHLEIPLSITLWGTLVGLVVSTLFPWPWPGTQTLPTPTFAAPIPAILPGLYPWPLWHELPDWLAPGTWTLGLATGLAGAFAGTVVLRGVRFLFGLGRGIEGLGMGDADLMMMAGAFVGWQPILIAFFVAVLPGLVFGVAQLFMRGDQAMPFGPPLCIGVLLTLWFWPVLGLMFQPLLMNGELMGTLAVFGGIFLLVAGYFLRLIRGAPTEPEKKPQ